MIDPAFRFSWIRQTWDTTWILKAEDIALSVVSLNNTLTYKSNSFVQMKEYRDTKIPQFEELQHSVEPDSWDAFAREIGAMDVSAESPSGLQDVDQEYQAYIVGKLSDKKHDPLKFWEVRTCFGDSMSQPSWFDP